MFCGKCSVERTPGAKFCSNCGTAFERRRSAKIYILISLLVVAIAVVTGIIVSVDANKQENQLTDSDKPELIKQARSKVFTIFTDDGQGSGFLYDDEGHVITSGHVVAGYSEVTVKNQKGHELTGKVIGIDDFFDLAVIQVDEFKGDQPLEIGMYMLDVGSEIIAFGTPLGLENTASVGYVTANLQGAYQLDAQVASGSSGGPVIDTKTGKVIGINTGMFYDEISIPYANPLPAVLPLINKWIEKPMTAEEVEVVSFPEEEWDEEEGMEEATLDEVGVSNFIHEFRTYQEMAVSQGEFFYLEDNLYPNSQAYKSFHEEFVRLIEEDVKLKLVSTQVDGVSITGNRAKVVTDEVTEIIGSGKSEMIEKKLQYTISIDEYGYYVISELKQL